MQMRFFQVVIGKSLVKAINKPRKKRGEQFCAESISKADCQALVWNMRGSKRWRTLRWEHCRIFGGSFVLYVTRRELVSLYSYLNYFMTKYLKNWKAMICSYYFCRASCWYCKLCRLLSSAWLRIIWKKVGIVMYMMETVCKRPLLA